MMRKVLAPMVLSMCFAAVPCFAGEVTITNGVTSWHSTQCPAPAVPPVLTGASSESGAEDMNLRIGQYNVYAGQVQAYMDCMNREAQADASHAADSILTAAQANVMDAHQQAEALGAPLKASAR